jgi:hypothetical protein
MHPLNELFAEADEDRVDAAYATDETVDSSDHDLEGDRVFDESSVPCDTYDDNTCDANLFTNHASYGNLSYMRGVGNMVQWRRFYVVPLEMEIDVSSDGFIRYPHDYQSSTQGNDETGSPYRIFTIYSKEFNRSVSYYAHELVWVAFHGMIPNGWEVRHKSHVRVREHDGRYSNALSDLDIYRKYTDSLTIQWESS